MLPEGLKGKKTIVVGAGISGQSAARFLARQGAEVVLNDLSDLDRLKDLKDEGVRLEGGGHRPELFCGKDIVVLSPGVPPQALKRALAQAAGGGAEIISEIELASRFIDVPVIGITGTNGKSSTTTLLGDMLRAGGRKVFAGGNLGTPLTGYLLDGEKADTIVVELSSFQLERIVHFRPRISVMLNVSPDHLDRYDSMKKYVEAKRRLFLNQGPRDHAVINMDDIGARKMAAGLSAEVVPFGTGGKHAGGLFLEKDRIISEIKGAPAGLDVSTLAGRGLFIENVMAAAAAALICGIDEKAILGALAGFAPLPHRMEYVGEGRGVKFIDDSKATNVGAVVKSLESISGRAVLIAGGKDKGGGYAPLKRPVKDKVRALILIGEAARKMKADLDGEAPVFLAATMKDAVKKAWSVALADDVILLSPACSSYDMFRDYKERGDAFRRAANDLISINTGTKAQGQNENQRLAANG